MQLVSGRLSQIEEYQIAPKSLHVVYQDADLTRHRRRRSHATSLAQELAYEVSV